MSVNFRLKQSILDDDLGDKNLAKGITFTPLVTNYWSRRNQNHWVLCYVCHWPLTESLLPSALLELWRNLTISKAVGDKYRVMRMQSTRQYISIYQTNVIKVEIINFSHFLGSLDDIDLDCKCHRFDCNHLCWEHYFAKKLYF